MRSMGCARAADCQHLRDFREVLQIGVAEIKADSEWHGETIRRSRKKRQSR